MFPGDSGTALESGHQKSGSIFRSRKRITTVTRRGSCSTTRGEDYKLTPTFDEGTCDEDEYHPISEREEE